MRTRCFVISLAASMLLVTGLAVIAQARTFVLPHVLDSSGRITNTQNTFDTTFFITYTGGLIDGTAGTGATVDFYIFDDMTGLPLRSATNVEVCNPCTFSPNAANRKGIGNIEGIANSVGGLPRPNVTGYMVFDVSGDSANVDISAFVFNSHTSANDLSVFSLNVQPIDDSFIPDETRTDVMPQWREDSMTNGQPFSFSQDLHVFYAGGLPGTSGNAGSTVILRLYDAVTGLVLQSLTGNPVCDPCTVNLSTTNRKQTFSFDQLVRNAGGFPRADLAGFATIETTGDRRNLFVQEIATNTHTSAFDSTFGGKFGPFSGQLAPEGELINGQKVMSFAHVYETEGTILTTQSAFDTDLEMTYTGGLAGLPAGTGATVDLFLFDQATGNPMMNNGQVVCGPCNFSLSPSARKISVKVDDLITARGPFDQAVKLGFGFMVVGGEDPDGVNVQGFVVNSHTGPFDLSVFGFTPEVIRSTEAPRNGLKLDDIDAPEETRRTLFKEYTFSHFRERVGKTNTTTFTFDTEFHAAYHGSGSATFDLYLYDENTSQPLRSLLNTVVCNPCTFPLNGPNRKRRIIVDDLLTAAGGIPRPDVGGFAKIKVTGDAGNVAVLGMLVNSHSGPNDLSTSNLPHRLSVRRTTDLDFDGDGRADIAVFRPSVGDWYIANSSTQQVSALHWGQATDKIAPGDYDGDGKTDIAVWRPDGNGDPDRSFYYILQSSNSAIRAVQFGRNGDRPVVGDWDGDGKDDLSVYREGATQADQSFFFHRPSGNPSVDFIPFAFGSGGDRPVVGDWDGDARNDPAVFRPSDGNWYILNSRDGSFRAERWGLSTDTPVPGDFDGDGRVDIAVWRPSNGTWYISQSSNNGIQAVNWGIPTDIPVPGDYDGDGRDDIGVFRPSENTWYIIGPGGNPQFTQFGAPGDRPVPCGSCP